jgi:hypothetical protein
MNNINRILSRLGEGNMLFAIGLTSGLWFGLLINPTELGWGFALGSTIICIITF